MAMPAKNPAARKKTIAVCLSPRLVAMLDEDRKPGESRSNQFARLLVKGLGLEGNNLFKTY